MNLEAHRPAQRFRAPSGVKEPPTWVALGSAFLGVNISISISIITITITKATLGFRV